MTLTQIILTIIVQVLFCLGLKTIMSKGMIFHFIKRPFEYEPDSKTMNFLREIIQRRALAGEEGLLELRREYTKLSKNLSFFLKPILLCVVCFSSFWGGLVFIFLHGFKYELIICCISSAFLLQFVNEKIDF